jgi:hypothetical protein
MEYIILIVDVESRSVDSIVWSMLVDEIMSDG